MTEKKLIHINLPKELHQNVKVTAAKLYRSINDCYAEALESWLEINDGPHTQGREVSNPQTQTTDEEI